MQQCKICKFCSSLSGISTHDIGISRKHGLHCVSWSLGHPHWIFRFWWPSVTYPLQSNLEFHLHALYIMHCSRFFWQGKVTWGQISFQLYFPLQMGISVIAGALGISPWAAKSYKTSGEIIKCVENEKK